MSRSSANISPYEKRIVLISFVVILSLFWSSGVFCEDVYPEIHRVWPSLKMPNVIISRETADGAGELNRNETMKANSSMPTKETSASLKKTVVFPSPICVSLPIAPCIILQVFWRNSSSSVLGVRVPVKRIPSFPRPRERQLSSSQLYNLYSGKRQK